MRPSSTCLPAILGISLCAYACNDEETPRANGFIEIADENENSQPQASVEVIPKSATLTLDDTQTFRAVVKDRDGKEVIAADVRWSSTDQKIATVDSAGNVTPKAGGEVKIKACALDIEICGEAVVTVQAPPPLTQQVVGTWKLEFSGDCPDDLCFPEKGFASSKVELSGSGFTLALLMSPVCYGVSTSIGPLGAFSLDCVKTTFERCSGCISTRMATLDGRFSDSSVRGKWCYSGKAPPTCTPTDAFVGKKQG